MVDRDLNIRKYTEYISSEFNVVEQDVGRSLRYISYNFATIDLLKLCKNVLETNHTVEQRCASVSGKTYLIRIAPYHEAGTEIKSESESSAKKELKGLVLTFVDTTKQVDDKEQIDEMAKALRAAVRAGKEKETFLSHMSHDMRTPMTAIFGLTQLSLEESGVPDVVRDNLEKILTSSRYLLSLIEEILETSRIDAGKVVSVSSAVKEENVINSVATIVSEQARAAGLTFEYNVRGSRDKYVLMDVQHVERALLNLLSNSMKFTPKGGKIQFFTDVTYDGDNVVHTYIIRDNGIGISREFQKKMFLPFEQEQENDGFHRDGTGLGLYICKNLIELMGGTIACSSAQGVGTEFTVTMKYSVASKEQIELQTHKSETYEDQVLYGKNVLLAEDNPVNAEVIIKLLKTKGIHCEIACDGQEALERYSANGPYHFQAILLDLMMPVKSGLQAARELRALGTADCKVIPLIALTADITNDTEQRCADAGIDYVVSKPIDQSTLFGYLAEGFQKHIEIKESDK